MRITIEHSAYNERRYGRHWIGRIGTQWPVGGRPTIEWGVCLSKPGDAGECEIEASPGTIIRWGQRDMRGNGTTNKWAIVQPDGTLVVCSPEHARNWWLKENCK